MGQFAQDAKDYEASLSNQNDSLSTPVKSQFAQDAAIYEAEQKSIAQANAYNASLQSADEAARRKQLADQLKAKTNEDWAPSVIDPNDVQRRVNVLDANDALQNSPKLSNRYNDSQYAARTLDDATKLSKVEGLSNKLLSYQLAGMAMWANTASKATDVTKRLAFGSFASGTYDVAAGFNALLAAPLELISEYGTKGLGQYDVIGQAGKYLRSLSSVAQKESADTRRVMGFSPESYEYNKAPEFMGQVYSAGESVVQNLELMPLSLLRAMQGATAISTTFKSLLPIGAVTAGQEYGAAREQGVTPGTAAIYGLGQGAVEMGTEALPLGKLVKDIKLTAPLWKVLRNQLITENIGEQAATALQDLNAWAILPENKDKTIGDYWSERPNAILDTAIQTTLATVMQTGLMRSAAMSERRQMTSGQLAVDGEQNLNEIIDTVRSTKSHTRNPADVKDLLDDIGASDVHIDAAVASQILNQSQLDKLVSSDALQSALQSGGDIVVPASQFTMAVATDESMQPIVEHVRINPELPSAAEARQVQAQREEMVKQNQLMSEESQKILEDAATEQSFKDSAIEVENLLNEQIKSTAAVTPEVAQSSRAYAKSIMSFYVTQASRMKDAEGKPMKPMDLYRMLPYDITTGQFAPQAVTQGAAPGQVQPLYQAGTVSNEVDANQQTISPAVDDTPPIEQPIIPVTVDDQAVLDTAFKTAQSKVWNKGRDLKLALQSAVQGAAEAAGVDLSAPSPQSAQYLIRVGVKDALVALKQNPNAIGWYDLKTRQALAIMALVHPEIATDQDARFAFTWALAVTSNGLKVDKNFELAEKVYAKYKKTGKMPTDIKGGQAQGAINQGLDLFNQLKAAWGMDNLRKFMMTTFTVGEITSLNKELSPGGEHAETNVRGAAILGPKIGNGFFSNLYGRFDALTMDRWLIRTWGRWTGTLIKPMPQQTALARSRLQDIVKTIAGDAQEANRIGAIVGMPITDGMDVDALSAVVQKASMDPELRNQMNLTKTGETFRKAGNSLAKYLDGQKEAPSGPGERNYIRQIFTGMLNELRKMPEYANLEMADLQAVLWYAEKRLYETAKEDAEEIEETSGYSDEEAPDYANAAAAVARSKRVSQRAINNALKLEQDRGRTRDAGLQAGTDEASQKVQEQYEKARGFTSREKRLFRGAVATWRARSNRVGDEELSWSYRGKDHATAEGVRVLKKHAKLKVQSVREWKAGKKLSAVFRNNGLVTATAFELAPTPESAQRFQEIITKAKTDAGEMGAAVYVYSAEDYVGMRLFIDETGESGVAVKPDGDIVSLFSNNGSGRSMLEVAVAAGGRKLDAFDTILPQMYAAHGFVATSRLKWDDSQAPEGWNKDAFKEYNNGEPDVVFMVYNPKYFGQYEKDNGILAASYDDAVAYQTAAMQQVESGGILFQKEQPIWKSVLLESVNNFKFDKASATDWLNYFKGKVKQEELEATDLPEFLGERAGVTKQEILAYLNSNGVQVRETMYYGDIEKAINDIANVYGYSARYEYGDTTFEDENGNPAELEDLPEDAQDEIRDMETTQYHRWSFQLDNYQELLLNLPVTKPTIVKNPNGQNNYILLHPNGSPILDPYDHSITLYPNPWSAKDSVAYKAYGRLDSFRGEHWNELNVLAHVRFGDIRTDKGKTLFIEEIQSDWGQEGRKAGFTKTFNYQQAADPLQFKIKQLREQLWQLEDSPEYQTEILRINDELSTVLAQLSELDKRYKDVKRTELETEKKVIPAAPFVQDTKSWTALAIKRMLRYAADNGYKRIAFINGLQSAERYSLRQSLEYLSYDPKQQWLRGWDARRKEVLNKTKVKPEDLASKIGKEAAEKLLATEPTFGGVHLLEGEGLEVGGQGMIGYYNGIVPQVLSKLVGKFGAKPYLEDLGLQLHPKKTVIAQEQMVVDITPEMMTEFEKPMPLFQQTAGPRGGFDVSKLTTILTQKSDMSTLLHETGHFYLEALFRLAAMPNAPESVKNDAQTVLNWFGVPNIETWNSMSLEDQRKYHEQWAYNHEIYLYEGKAPSLKLQSIFDKFTAWLKDIYKSIRDDLNVIYRQEHGEDLPMLTGEVRQVMDRLLATDEQIQQAEDVRNIKPIYQTQEESGMSDDEWAAYQELQQESHDSMLSSLATATLKQMKWLSNARSKLLKAQQRKVEETRKGVHAEATKEVEAMPLYRAIRFLRTGKLEDEAGNPIEVLQGNKLNKNDVSALYPAGALVAGPDMKKLRGMMSEDGLPPDLVAGMFGFPSGDAMIRAIAEAKPIKDAINDRTDERMLTEHSELMNAEVAQQNIERALHTEMRARVVAVELRHLAKFTQPVRVMLEAAKQAAKQILSTKKIRDIRPRDYSLAEARASKKALELMKKGQTAEAGQSKQAELLQGRLAAEAVSIRDEVDRALEGFKKFFRPDAKVAKTRDMDLVNAARAILSAFGLGPKGKSPFDFVDQLRAYNPDLYAELEPIMFKAASGAQNYKDLTIDEFRAVQRAVNALWFNAKRDKQIMIEGRAMELQAVLTDLNSRMEQIGIPNVVPGETKAPTKMERFQRTINNTKALLRRVEHWADAFDGEGGPGAFTKYIWRPIKDALNDYRLARNNYVKRYAEMIQQLDLPVGIIEAPELGYSFGHDNGGIGKAELLGALLHIGNDSNFKKLLVGRKWGEIMADGTLNTGRWDLFIARMIKEGKLTKMDYDFLQQVWDLNEEIKPLAQKAHKDMFGYYFKEVANNPFTNQFGSYRGGYVPAKTDPFIVRDVQRQSKMESLEADFRNAMPSTGMGFTKGRVEYNQALSLDVRLMTNHIDSVIRFAMVQPAVKDVLKILRNRKFSDSLTRIDPSVIEQMLIPWLNRSARQITSEVGKSSFMDSIWRGIRQRTGISIMFGNLRNALQQLTGYFPAALKVKPTYLKSALSSYMSDTQKVTEEVVSLSKFMEDRLQNQIFDIQENLNDILLNPTKFDKLKKWVTQHGYFLQTAFQNQVDIVTWTATYNQTMAESGLDQTDEKAMREAVQRADAAVRLTQSSLSAEDLAAFEVGTPFMKTLTHFGGYMNMMANLNTTAFVKTIRDLGWRGNKGKLLYIYLCGIALPALIGDAIMRGLGAGWDDDDDDGYLDEFMAWFFGSQGKMVTGMVPFAGQLATATYGAFTAQQYDDKISISPSITALESAGGTVKAGMNIVDPDKEVTGKNVRDVMTFLSLTTGIPMTVLGRPVGYLVDISQGKVEPTSGYDVARGLVTGVASSESNIR